MSPLQVEPQNPEESAGSGAISDASVAARSPRRGRPSGRTTKRLADAAAAPEDADDPLDGIDCGARWPELKLRYRYARRSTQHLREQFALASKRLSRLSREKDILLEALVVVAGRAAAGSGSDDDGERSPKRRRGSVGDS